MTAAELRAYLRERGVELWVDGDQLRYSAPHGVMTPALRAELAGRKMQILAQLRGGAPGAGAATSAREVVPGAGGAEPVSMELPDLEGAAAYTRYVNPYLGHRLTQVNLGVEYVRGEGCYLYDAAGRRYLDFIAQYGAVPFGYNPPEIWRALENARREGAPSFVQPSLLADAGKLAERLIGVAPPGLRYVTFTNSGAEAVEAALKLCRSATRRPGILAAQNSFHGKTLGALSATGRQMYQAAFGAPVAGFDHVPFGDIEALRHALAARPGHYAAFIVEPILGEGGMVEPPPGYLAAARRACESAGTLLVVDEVQTGLGRTGCLFACEHEGVTPDVLTLAKALGGGLMPIGACLCSEPVYNPEFALRHSSTFGGNALACRAGLATLDRLERDGRALIRHVAEHGRALKGELEALRARYPGVVKSVRGRGYMLAVQFDLSSVACRQGLLGYLTAQQLFTSLVVSYLLNVEGVRVATPMSAADVLRIEPPLVAGWAECRRFLEALERTLQVVERGHTARLVGHLVGADVGADPLPAAASAFGSSGHRRAVATAAEDVGHFAFLFNLDHARDCVVLDPSLGALSDEQIADLKKRGLGLLAPSVFSEAMVESKTGLRARGHFVLVPYTAEELMAMPRGRALAQVRAAIEVGRAAGARIVGMGGFTSIVTQAGLALGRNDRPALTTGNSYTVAAGWRAVETARRSRGGAASAATVAVVGAAGVIGQVASMLLGEDAARLILVGSPMHAESTRARLCQIAGRVAQHLWRCHEADRRRFAADSLGARVVSRVGMAPPTTPDGWGEVARDLERFGAITISTDVRVLRDAEVVLTATSAFDSFITAASLRRDALVCEISRPFNVSADVRAARPDVLWIEGGLVHVPGRPDLGLTPRLPPGLAFACIAETMVLALERIYQDTSLGADVGVETVRRLDALAERHGFAVAC